MLTQISELQVLRNFKPPHMCAFAVTIQAKPLLILSKTLCSSEAPQSLKLWMDIEDGEKMGKLCENKIVCI